MCDVRGRTRTAPDGYAKTEKGGKGKKEKKRKKKSWKSEVEGRERYMGEDGVGGTQHTEKDTWGRGHQSL